MIFCNVLKLWYDRNMKKVLVYFVVVFMALVGATTLTPTNANAACSNEGAFFALRPWYHGLTDDNCNVKIDDGTADGIAKFVWSIVLNILYDISVLVGYIAIVMVAWGGYLYMFSRGEPARAEKGKKTLIAAVVGLVIAMLASVIMNTIVLVLTGGN